MRHYELLFIISPKLSDQKVTGVVDQVKDHITNLGATVTKVENLGRRKLAYEIDHFSEGTYALIQFESQGDEILELERRLRVMEPVLRYLTVRLDADLKRMKRMKRKRAHRKALKEQAKALREPLAEESSTKRSTPLKSREQR